MTETSSDGIFSIGPIRPGAYEVSAVHPAVTISDSTSVKLGSDINIRPDQLPRIKGFVVDPSGLAVAAPAGGAGGSGRSSHAAPVKDVAAAAAGRMVSAAVIAARYAGQSVVVNAPRSPESAPLPIFSPMPVTSMATV